MFLPVTKALIATQKSHSNFHGHIVPKSSNKALQVAKENATANKNLASVHLIELVKVMLHSSRANVLGFFTIVGLIF